MAFSFSFIIPVYNRPDEVKELLGSFEKQEYKGDYEILIVEDGSTVPSEEIVKSFKNLPVRYFFKENSGPGPSRNYGMEQAAGDYFIILDSDCILPPTYIHAVKGELDSAPVDFFGGPDAAHEDFSSLQKAINYSMTAMLTTGGIRGKKKAAGKFQPRSFNMGISKQAFLASGGFGKIHPGEDPDLTLRLWKMGFKSRFIANAFVYHKRRISWKSFYGQVRKFGLVRPILNLWHPDSAKLTYWFPTVFIVGAAMSILLFLAGFALPFVILLLYLLILMIDASIKNRSIAIGITAVFATLVQFVGYGLGFAESMLAVRWFKKLPQEQFPHLFFD
ncbi:glycosyltransferase [Flavimarina sp. Hel_I_48]|uniref:glycosyltransferase n=1 Tax=Flavimarina sp. Hel_I_48 TaxID=1392488 RepID=UPI0004DFC09B|nr:glycosyltransferase [Flavimarina sp. Hel_I_48]